ncbi:MAG: lipopolysaccharide biosynthesis protein [Muribaculaceae bacterium]|nr:lipopolysaccharide biosynthesis protein [Muribaculaceae bacterium]
MATQVLYAVTGIVLARILSTEEIGLVGAVAIFQAFAALIIDSGFSYALLQRKSPTRLDYSTVLWFNIFVSVVLYVVLYFVAPSIAGLFQNDERLVGLSRGMFVVLILNASAIVQINRLMKRMDVRMVALANSAGLFLGGIAGIVLAIKGFGAWAIVWQSIIIAASKSLILWIACKWTPLFRFSFASLRSFSGVAAGMMGTSFLNTVFLNIYGFIIGNRVGLSSLGYYSQSDKWSKMGISSLSQVLTSTFVPALSQVQDDDERFRRICSRMNRFTAYLLMPAMIGMMVLARPAFHFLFGAKWDPSIVLFQLLALRGVFVVLNSLYNNYLLARGEASLIMKLEVLRDTAAVIALFITLPVIKLSTPEHPVLGLEYLLWGQLIVTVLTWIATLFFTCNTVGASRRTFIMDLVPYFAQAALIAPVMEVIGNLCPWSGGQLAIEVVIGAGCYLILNRVAGSRIQKEVLAHLLRKSN